MNAPKMTDLEYITFLVAAPHVVSCTEAARVQPDAPRRAAHDAVNRLLQRLKPDTAPMWQEAELLVDRTRGLLVIDDTTLDKPYARKIALVHRQWSGKHHRIVAGINLVTLVWSDDTHAVPCDYRLYDAPNDGDTKNDHFRAMLKTAQKRGFTPRYVCFDGWYSSLENLKLIRTLGWQWLTRLKHNRLVNPDGSGNRPLAECAIREAGTRVHLKGYGFILVFRIDTPDGDTEYWASSDELMTMAGARPPRARFGRLRPIIVTSSSFVASKAVPCVRNGRNETISAGLCARIFGSFGTKWKPGIPVLPPNWRSFARLSSNS